MNVLLGFLSILMSVNAYINPSPTAPGEPTGFDIACWLILWATIFDVLDGKVAKLTGTSSDFGMRLDTFADATTFGLAPAILIFCTYLSPLRLIPPLGWIACGSYFTAAVFRLARYNVQSMAAPSFGFVGVPTPTAALISVSFYLSTHELNPPSWLAAALMILVALFMVSPVRYPALKGLFPIEKMLLMALLLVMIVLCVLYGPALSIFLMFSSFALLWGPFWVPTRRFWVPELRAEANAS
jgi:CDP-diacylglycerol--serine O-phosphatidyltransferase